MTGTLASLRSCEAEAAWEKRSIRLVCHILEGTVPVPHRTLEHKHQGPLEKGRDGREVPGRTESGAL